MRRPAWTRRKSSWALIDLIFHSWFVIASLHQVHVADRLVESVIGILIALMCSQFVKEDIARYLFHREQEREGS